MERVVLVPSLEEDDDEGVLPIDMDVIPKGRYRWVAAKFNKSALSRHFEQARDSLTPFFETFSQYRLYHRGIDARPMHTK